ncbi:MAG: TRAP transporter large permease [Alphaproteobacteria bacterium]|nr:TRAP transporter large permease [Alphaproteobacteria bacterium]
MILAAVCLAIAIFFVIGVPIAFAIGIGAWFYMLLADIPTVVLAQQVATASESWVLLAMPLFVLAGLLLNDTGIAQRLVDFAAALVGHLRGGLGMVNVLANMLFGGISGSAVADSAALGSILIPGMKRHGYPVPFAAALTSSAASIGIIIPPSLPMILFGAITGTSVGALFIGGIIPGILVGLTLMAVVAWLARRNDWKAGEPFSWCKLYLATKRAALGLGMPILLIGGILGGIFTPTEAAGVTVVYALVVATFVYRSLDLKAVYRTLVNAGVLTAVVMIIIATSFTFGWVMTHQQLPQHVAQWFLELALPAELLLLVVAAILLALGFIMHGDPMLLIVVPVVFPAAVALGIDPVHFGLLCVMTVAVGQQTPPVGSTLFVVSALTKLDIFTVSRANIPFILALTAITFLVLFFPQLTLWLPKLVGLR